jgi:cell wall-associated NlpC family hydrolase
MLIEKIISTGYMYLNTPYVFNAPSNRTDMFDCSSFIQHIFRCNGINLPRNSRKQFLFGRVIPFNQIKKGDLMFFTTKKRKGLQGVERVGHVALYIGNNKILHTFQQGKKVQISTLKKHWLDNYVGSRRIIHY